MDRSNNNENRAMSYSVNKDDLLLLVLAVFIPPVSVWKRKGFFSRDSLLNVFLFLLLFFPAIIHACYVVYETSEERTFERSSSVYRDLEAQPEASDALSEAQPPAYVNDDDAGAEVPLMDNKQSQSLSRT